MFKRHTHRRSVFAVLAVGLSLLASHVYAQSNIPSGAFVVRPAKVEVELAPGESRVVDVVLENGTPTPLSIAVSTEDIAPKVQTSATDDPIMLSAEGVSGEHSLKNFLTFPKSSIEALSYKQVHVPVTVTIPTNAVPGGRYGSVVFEFAPAISAKDQPVQNIAVKSRVATLFFVRVKGVVHEEGSLAAFGLFNNARTSLSPTSERPLRFQVAFENKGDVQLNPHGTITIKSTWGKSVEAPIDPWVVLPASTRMREIDYIESLSPGYYHATLEQARGYSDALDTREIGFWVIPSPVQTFFGLIALILLILLLRRSLAISRHFVS